MSGVPDERELPIACSLESDELPERAAQMARLGSEALTGLSAGGASATLRFRADEATVAAVSDFIEAESACCRFFSFGTAREDGEIVLSIEAPDDAEWAVRGLVAGFVAGWGGLP